MNEKRIWDYLTEKGLPKYGAAGLMGNIFAESGLNPQNLQNTYEKKFGMTDAQYTAAVDGGSYKDFVRDSAGYGLAQWTYWSRKELLLSYAKKKGVSIGDLEMQLDFLWEELSGKYKGVLDGLKGAGSVREASDIVLTQFERPADQSEAVKERRASYGQGYYEKYGKESGKEDGMVQVKTKTANRSNYGGLRALSKIEYIVIHYTANDGDSDEGNANYFASNIVKASAHYFVDDDSTTQSVPDDYIAYAVGGKRYNTAGGRLYGVATNTNSISIELCDTVKNGVIYPTEATIRNALDLVRELMKKYGIPHGNVIRHWDVTGKPCPAYWTDDAKWKTEFWDRIPEYGKLLAEKKYQNLKETFLRSEPKTGSAAKVKYADLPATMKKKCAEDRDGWARILAGKPFIRVRSYTDGKGDKWFQTKSGYWLPAVYNGEKRVEAA